MTSQVFGRCPNRDAAFKNLQTDIGPLADGLKVDTPVDEGLCEITTTGAESICPNCDGTRDLVCFKKFYGLPRKK